MILEKFANSFLQTFRFSESLVNAYFCQLLLITFLHITHKYEAKLS